MQEKINTMCLAIPVKIVSIDQEFLMAEVDVMGNTKTVSVALTPEAQAGSWVLVHAGQAITIISEEEARSSLELWEELIRDQD